MPLVEISLLEGRSDEQRRAIAEAITDTIVKVLGVDPEVVWVIFRDVPKGHLAVGGKIKR
ncbi:MAG: 2-hydroxymuconate tautomerase [Nitrososphaerota archaeon]